MIRKIKFYYARWKWKREWLAWAKEQSGVPPTLLDFLEYDTSDTRGVPPFNTSDTRGLPLLHDLPVKEFNLYKSLCKLFER